MAFLGLGGTAAAGTTAGAATAGTSGAMESAMTPAMEAGATSGASASGLFSSLFPSTAGSSQSPFMNLLSNSMGQAHGFGAKDSGGAEISQAVGAGQSRLMEMLRQNQQQPMDWSWLLQQRM